MENQVTVVVAADGRILHKEQNGVFRRSNGQNKLVALLDFSSEYVVKVNFLRPDGVKPKSQYMAYTDKRDYDGKSYSAYEYVMKEFQLDATGQLVVSLNMQNGSTVATSGDFIIDVEASESSYDDVAPTDPNQFDETVQSLMQTDAKLLDRTANVPNLVASIQKVAPNAITYTDNSGVESAPIVIEGGETAPIPVNAASTIQIPQGAWQPAEDGQTVTGYKYIVTAGLHGQMRDGATANDLWVSFDEADSAAFRGAYEDYTVDTAGNITISVTQPIAMTVRVWNGKGLVDEAARADIAAETARAEAAEAQLQKNIDAETARAESVENGLQQQIDHIEDSGYDRTAREMIAAETERAETAETQLQQNIDAEKMRAEAAAEQLQERLQEQIDDLETSKVDVSGGTMNDKLVVKGNNFPHVQVLNTVEGLSGYFEQSGGSLDIIARDAEGENLSYISLEDGIVRSHAALYENDQRVYSPNNPPPAGEVSSVNGQTGAVTITPENIGAATSAAVQSAQNTADSALTKANDALPLSGGTMTGAINVPYDNNLISHENRFNFVTGVDFTRHDDLVINYNGVGVPFDKYVFYNGAGELAQVRAREFYEYGQRVYSPNNPLGFSLHDNRQEWGNQIGAFITGFSDTTGGSIAFRRDNPVNGQMSMIIDGTVYVNEGNDEVYSPNNRPYSTKELYSERSISTGFKTLKDSVKNYDIILIQVRPDSGHAGAATAISANKSATYYNGNYLGVGTDSYVVLFFEDYDRIKIVDVRYIMQLDIVGIKIG